VTSHKLFMLIATVLGTAAAVTAVIPGAQIASIPLGVAASGVSGLAAYLAHGNDAVAAGQAAVAAAAAKAIQTLPSDHPALPVVKAIVAATADDSNPAV
jgi:hypothetical protein